jgi:hypothetical protein
MEWDIEFTDEFERWWNDLSQDEQDSVDQMVRLLQMRGPSLGRPHADLIQSSRHSNMKELRVQQAGSIVCYLLSIRNAVPFCSPAGIRPGTIGGMRNSSQSQIDFMRNIW